MERLNPSFQDLLHLAYLSDRERDRVQWYRRGGESSLIIQLPQFMPLQSNNDRGEKEVGEEATPSKTMRNWVKKWTLTKTEEMTKSRKATM